MLEEKTPSEFKLVLDKLEDFNDIVRVFESMTDAQVYSYFTGLTDAAWKQTSPSEWRSYIDFLDSQGFKGILDYMSTDEILYVWQFFDERMTAKFIDGLSMADMYAFTPAEWHAAYMGMAPSAFKATFFDKMDTKGIWYVSEILGDMDDFLEGLTVEDWKNMTAAEWECFLAATEIEDLVEFIHEMAKVDLKIVYDMFKFMPLEMLSDFKEAPELSYEFSPLELETMGHAVDVNVYKTEEPLFEDAEEFERPHHKKDHRNRKNKRHHQGKRDERQGHGPEKPRNKKFGKHQ